ncbi:MAG: hypothetical protein H6715_01895 [Myxococcales bacterium]|nr:hypothetical protein [Myxococcales bacterium]
MQNGTFGYRISACTKSFAAVINPPGRTGTAVGAIRESVALKAAPSFGSTLAHDALV